MTTKTMLPPTAASTTGAPAAVTATTIVATAQPPSLTAYTDQDKCGMTNDQ